jgi:hypothetical protein
MIGCPPRLTSAMRMESRLYCNIITMAGACARPLCVNNISSSSHAFERMIEAVNQLVTIPLTILSAIPYPPSYALIRCAALDGLRVTLEIGTYTNSILALETLFPSMSLGAVSLRMLTHSQCSNTETSDSCHNNFCYHICK